MSLTALLTSHSARATVDPATGSQSPQVIVVALPTWSSSALDLGMNGARQVLVADISLVTNSPTEIKLAVVPSTMSSPAGASVPFQMFLLPKGPILGLYLARSDVGLVRPGHYSASVKLVISDD